MTASAAFERFRFSFFEDGLSARDGLDVEVLSQLQGDERIRAEDMLMKILPDERGVIGLGRLRSRRAEPRLLALFDEEHAAYDGEPSSRLVLLARALWLIRPDRRWIGAMVRIVASTAYELLRMDAARALSEMRDPDAVCALSAVLDDSAKLVRHHAARGLLLLHGLPDRPATNDPDHMIYRILSDDPARRQTGKDDVLAAIAGRVLSPV